MPCEKSKIVSFTSSIMKHIVETASQFKLSQKSTCCIAFGVVSNACCLLKSIAIIL